MTMEALEGHTPDHLNCPACEAARRRVLAPAEMRILPFPEAADLWLEEHRTEIAESTYRYYLIYLNTLKTFFKLPLEKIHIGHVNEYQKWRQQARKVNGRTTKAGPPLINHELNTLIQVLTRAGVAEEIKKFYKPLHSPRSRKGKALSEPEERKLFETAPMSPYWQAAYWGALLMANTTAGEAELLHLQLCDVDQEKRVIRIFEGVKNDYRPRLIPLNKSAWWAMKQILRRAAKLGVREPEHYIFPHRGGCGKKYDPTRPQKSWKRAWRSMRAAAGMPTLRMYDLRHHALTKLHEQPDVNEVTAQEIAGWSSGAMKQVYVHIREERKRKALESIEVKPGPTQTSFEFEGGKVLTFAQMAGAAKK